MSLPFVSRESGVPVLASLTLSQNQQEVLQDELEDLFPPVSRFIMHKQARFIIYDVN
jgi:hypothetical protein